MSAYLEVKMFDPKALSTVTTTIYTVPVDPATQQLLSAGIRVVNHGDATRNVTIYLVPSGDSADTTNIFLDQEQVKLQAHMDVVIPTLSAGDTIQMKQNAGTDITVHALGGTLWTP